MTRPSFAERRLLTREAFTLIELLVATAVGALVLVSLASIVTGTVALSRRTGDSLISYNAAATALDMIGSDLESLVSNREPFEFLAYSNQNVGNGVQNAGVLMMLTSSPTDLPTGTSGNVTGSGQARAVIYRLAHQDATITNGPNRVYGLYRSVETNAANVFSNWFTTNALGTVTNVSTPPPLDDFLVENIVDFRVRFYPPGTNAMLNTNATDIVSIRGNASLVNSQTNTRGLATAEIMVTVLDDAIVRQRVKGQTLSAAQMDELKRQHGRVLSRRVNLRLPY